MKTVLAFFSMSVKKHIAYPGALYIFCFTHTIRTGIALLTWLYAERTVFTGFTKPDLLLYYLLLFLIDGCAFWYIFSPVAAEIASGEILTYLLRPVSYIKTWFAREAGFKTQFSVIYIVSALLMVGCLHFFDIPVTVPSISLIDVLHITIALIIAIFQTFLLTFLLGLLAFWFTDVQFVDYLFFTVFPFLSGGIVPLAFFPEVVQKLNIFLPFRYQTSFALEMVFHRVNTQEIYTGYAIALAWIVIFYSLAHLLMKKGTKAYMAYGQ